MRIELGFGGQRELANELARSLLVRSLARRSNGDAAGADGDVARAVALLEDPRTQRRHRLLEIALQLRQ